MILCTQASRQRSMRVDQVCLLSKLRFHTGSDYTADSIRSLQQQREQRRKVCAVKQIRVCKWFR